MHNLKTNFDKILDITKSIFQGSLNADGNFYFYPIRPKMSDGELIALSVLGESIGIDSENYLLGKLKSDIRGVFPSMELTKANVHDIHYLNEVKHSGITNCTLIADKVYISKPIQTDLFNNRQTRLETPYRPSQHDKKPFPYIFKKSRKRIDTLFSQLCDQLMLKRNYAKTKTGLSIRILCKISSVTMLQYINFLNHKPLNHLKYALAA